MPPGVLLSPSPVIVSEANDLLPSLRINSAKDLLFSESNHKQVFRTRGVLRMTKA